MVDFENQHLSIIEQYEASALDIERIFFTMFWHYFEIQIR